MDNMPTQYPYESIIYEPRDTFKMGYETCLRLEVTPLKQKIEQLEARIEEYKKYDGLIISHSHIGPLPEGTTTTDSLVDTWLKIKEESHNDG